MSIRTEKIADLIRDEISLVLQRKIKDHRIGFVTITEVEVTPGMKEAFVYVSIMGSDEQKKQSMKGIRSAAKFIRGEVGKKLLIRSTPRLIFREDKSLERGSEILAKLNQLKKDEEAKKK